MKKLLIYLLLLSPAMLNAQEVAIQYQFGYGKYSMKDIRDLQNRLMYAASSIGAKITERFPAHYTQSVSIGGISASGRNHYALNATFLTTGGRVHVADYSGEYRGDMLLKGYRWGFFYRRYIASRIPWANMYIQIEPGILSSRLKMEEELTIGTQQLSDDKPINFKSTALYLEPSTGFRFKPTKWMHLLLSCGYEIDMKGKMKQSGSNKIPYNGDDKIRWSGIRLNAGLVFAIPGSKFD